MSGIDLFVGGNSKLAPTFDYLLDLKKEVVVVNADIATCGFLTNSKVESVFGKRKES